MKKYLPLFLILGFIFKLGFAYFIPQPFGWDQSEYDSFTYQIARNGLTVWPSRLYGYPLIMALFYNLFTLRNDYLFDTVYPAFHAMVDCATAVLVYKIAEELFESKKPAFIAFLFYLFNPFTSAFVGVFMSEVVAVFFAGLIFYLLMRFLKTTNYQYLLPLSFSLGYFPQIKPVFLFFCLILFSLVVYRLLNRNIKRKILPATFSFVLFILPFTYNIIGNWREYNRFSPTLVSNLFVRELYISLYVPERSPFQAADPSVFPPQVQQIYNEYIFAPKNKTERKKMADKYLSLSIAKIKREPIQFVISRLKKLFYVWEKHYLFYYYQPESKVVEAATYRGNILLLVGSAIGFFIWFRKELVEGDKASKWFGSAVLFYLFYISVAHSFSLAEERYSLPGYSLIFLFAGYSVYTLLNRSIVNLLN